MPDAAAGRKRQIARVRYLQRGCEHACRRLRRLVRDSPKTKGVSSAERKTVSAFIVARKAGIRPIDCSIRCTSVVSEGHEQREVPQAAVMAFKWHLSGIFRINKDLGRLLHDDCVLFVQHPFKNALRLGLQAVPLLRVQGPSVIVMARRRGASRSRPVLVIRLSPSRSAGVSEGAKWHSDGSEGLGDQPGVFHPADPEPSLIEQLGGLT
jgi:hypothetical protein